MTRPESSINNRKREITMKKHMCEMEEMNMKKIASLVLALLLALTAFSAAFAEVTAIPGKPVIGIAWRAARGCCWSRSSPPIFPTMRRGN